MAGTLDNPSMLVTFVRTGERRYAVRATLAAVHCLLRREHERLRPRIANLSFDGEWHNLLHLNPVRFHRTLPQPCP